LIDQTLLNANGPLAAIAAQIGEDASGLRNARAFARIIFVSDPGRILEDSGQRALAPSVVGEVDGAAAALSHCAA
jgi:hypothetical protein